MNSAELLPIGTLASATGTTLATLRYYDELGLVPAVVRVGGKRRFGPESVGRVNFVRRAQRIGFGLDEIKELLDDTDRDWEALVATRLERLRDQRAELDDMIDILQEVQSCGCRVVAKCLRVGPLD